jgi:hypothetical protein
LHPVRSNMNYGKKLLLLPIILVGLTAFFYLSYKTFAQTTQTPYDVTVSPIFFDLTANPGDTLNSKIRIRNNTSSPIPIKLGVSKLTGDMNGNLTLQQNANDYTLSWFKFENDTITAKPLEWTDVPFSISVPESAAYGYYWTITLTQANAGLKGKSGVALTGAAGVPVLLKVNKPGAKADAKLAEFSVDNFISEYLPVNFTIKIQNTGNIHIKPHGSIFISDGRSKDLAVLDVNPGLGNIIPNSTRSFAVSWDDGFIVREQVMENGQPKFDKNGQPVEALQINWNKLTSFRIGKYTANLLLVYDNGTKDVPIEATISFWIFPWKVMIAIVIFLVIAFFVIRFLLRAYINREIRKRLAR